MGKLTSEERVQILADIVGIESVNDHELVVAEYLHDLLKKHDIDSKIIKLTDTRSGNRQRQPSNRRFRPYGCCISR